MGLHPICMPLWARLGHLHGHGGAVPRGLVPVVGGNLGCSQAFSCASAGPWKSSPLPLCASCTTGGGRGNGKRRGKAGQSPARSRGRERRGLGRQASDGDGRPSAGVPPGAASPLLPSPLTWPVSPFAPAPALPSSIVRQRLVDPQHSSGSQRLVESPQQAPSQGESGPLAHYLPGRVTLRRMPSLTSCSSIDVQAATPHSSAAGHGAPTAPACHTLPILYHHTTSSYILQMDALPSLTPPDVTTGTHCQAESLGYCPAAWPWHTRPRLTSGQLFSAAAWGVVPAVTPGETH